MNLPWTKEKISGEVYLGFHAGKQALNNIKKAEKSIFLISPYMSADYLSMLFQESSDRGLQLQCITQSISDSSAQCVGDAFGLRNIYSKILKSTPRHEEYKERQKNSLYQSARNYQIAAIGLACFFILYSVLLLLKQLPLMQDTKAISLFYLQLGFILLVLCIVCFIMYHKRSKEAQSVVTITYDYNFRHQLCLLPSRESNKSLAFPHVKLLIIDEKLAYLGSFNFTHSGIFHNIESCVKVTNQAALQALIKYFQELYTALHRHALSADYLGNYYAERKFPVKSYQGSSKKSYSSKGSQESL